MRLRADIWVSALLRRAQGEGAYATVARKGHPEGGSILLKVNHLNGLAVALVPIPSPDGTRHWLRASGQAPVLMAEVDALLERQCRADPDCWVVEIEDRQGRWFHDEKIIDLPAKPVSDR